MHHRGYRTLFVAAIVSTAGACAAPKPIEGAPPVVPSIPLETPATIAKVEIDPLAGISPALGPATRHPPPPPVSKERTRESSVAWSPNGKWLAITEKQFISIREVQANYREARRLNADDATDTVITSLVFSPDTQTLASASQQGAIRLWHVSNWKEERRFEHVMRRPASPMQLAYFSSLIFSPDGALLLSASDDGGWGGYMSLWTAHNGVKLRELDGGTAGSSLSFSADATTITGHSAVVGRRDWVTATGKLTSSPAPPREQRIAESLKHAPRSLKAKSIRDYDLSPDRQHIAVLVDSEKAVYTVNIATGRELPRPTPQSCSSVGYTPDGKTIWARCADEVVMWKANSAVEIARVNARWASVMPSRDGSRIVINDAPNVFVVVELDTARVIEF